MTQKASGGVGGTVGAFNFIRRVGFPSTLEVVSVLVTIASLATVLALPLAGVSLQATLLFALLVVVIPSIVGETANSILILHGDKVLNFRRLIGLEILSWFLLVVALPLGAIAGAAVSNPTLWIDGFFTVVVISLPVRFLTIASISSMHSRDFFLFGPQIRCWSFRRFRRPFDPWSDRLCRRTCSVSCRCVKNHTKCRTFGHS